MSLDFLPAELENIIDNYSQQIQHQINFAKYADELKFATSIRQEDIEYSYGLNGDTWELWCYHDDGEYDIAYVLEEHIFRYAATDGLTISRSFCFSPIEC